MVKMTEMIQNIQFCTKRLKYKLNKPLLSTFGEPKSQEIPIDYTQASQMNKITGRNTNTVPGDAVQAT